MGEEQCEKASHSTPLEQSVYADAKETTDAYDIKRRAIEIACQSRDVKALVEYATTTGGLLTDTLRQAACTCSPSIIADSH